MKSEIITKTSDVIIDIFRWAWVAGVSILLTVFEPLQDVLYLLLFSAFFDFVFGYGSARQNKEDFSGSKALKALFKVGSVIIITALVHRSVVSFNTVEEGREIAKWICWFEVVAYIINMLKNLCVIFPNSNMFKVAYKVITIDVKDYVIKYIKSRLPKVD